LSTLTDLQSRYVLPSFVERTSYGVQESNPYSKLFQERIVFLGAPVDDTSANDVMSQLLVLEAEDPDRDIVMYINSPGGSPFSAMAIYDTMQFVRPDIQTFCLGQALLAAALILSAGTPGKRYALQNSRVMVQQPSIDVVRGQVSDLQIQAAEITRVRAQIVTALSTHTGRPSNEVNADVERAKVFTADDAKSYGLVDHVVTSRKQTVAH